MASDDFLMINFYLNFILKYLMFTAATALLYALHTIVNIIFLYTIEKKLVILDRHLHKNKFFFNFYGRTS